MVSFHDMVPFREELDTKDRKIDVITQGSVKHNPDLPSDKTDVPVRRQTAGGDVDPKDSLEISTREKVDRDDWSREKPDEISKRHSARPILSPLTIPVPGDGQKIDTLPPRDTGWAAWRTLIAATVVSSFVSGIYLSFGVFHDYYVRDPEFGRSNMSAWIGVLSSGLPFLAAPLMTYLCQHFTLPRIHYVWIGWLVSIIALIGAAFCKTLPALIITQGLLFGIGVTIGDNPMMIIVNTWFLHRRGVAYGIVFGVCDLLGVAWSFLANYLLHRYGIRATFLIFAGIIGFGSGPCILLLKERGSTSILGRGSDTPHKTPGEDVLCSAVAGNFDMIRRDTPPTRQRYFYRPIFYVLVLSNLAQAFAFYLPLIYLPSYTTDLGYNSNKGAVVLAIVNLAQIVGEVGFGKLSDKINVHFLVVVSSTTAALSTFFLWGLSKDFGTLVAYAFMFGMSGAGYIALWARMGILFGEKDAQMVYSFMCTGRGLGAIVSGPISAKLLRGVLDRGMYGNGRYEFLVMFVGISMAISAALGSLGALGNVKTWFRSRQSVVHCNEEIMISHHS